MNIRGFTDDLMYFALALTMNALGLLAAFLVILVITFMIAGITSDDPKSFFCDDKPQACICKCCNKQANNQEKDEWETRHFTPIPVVFPKPLSIPHP